MTSKSEEDFQYRDAGVTCRGRLILPPGGDVRPGVVVFPDFTGIGDHSVGRGHRLAEELGYVALVADLYGNGEAPARPEARDVVASWLSRPGDLARRAAAAVDALEAHPRCNGCLGAIGFCFGGAAILALARAGLSSLRAGVSFHGVLATPDIAVPGRTKAKLLVCHGADDPFVGALPLMGSAADMKSKTLGEFLEEMSAARVDCQVIAYAGIVHAFTIPDADTFAIPGSKYDKATDDRSWKAMTAFFEETL